MKSCPNPTCPFAIKLKRAGEYEDTASTCSDCGGPLVDGAAPRPVVVKPAAAIVVPSDANRRLVVTLAAGVCFMVLSRLQVVGDVGVMDDIPRGSLLGLDVEEGAPAPLMALAAGMSPFIAGFLLVELMALVLPPLRALRVGGAVARKGLNRTAWALGFFLLFVQLFGIVRYQSSVDGRAPSVVVWAQLVLAHLAMLGLAFAVTRFGLGNGFGLFMGSTLLGTLLVAGATQYRLVLQEAVSLPVALVLVLILGAIAWAALRLGRAGRGGGALLPSAVPFPVSSNGGVAWAGAALSMPATLAAWSGEAGDVALQLESSMWLYNGLYLFIAFDVALVLGLLFFRPKVIGELWKQWVPGVDQTSVVAAARTLLPKALGLSIGLTVGVPFLLMLVGAWVGLGSAGELAILTLTLACATFDVVDEWSARRRLGTLINVWEVQRTAEVEPIFTLLRTAGIEAHAGSFLLRTTQQFFGPWIPVGILVPVTREAEARALIAGRLLVK